MMDDYDGQMIFGDFESLKLPDIRLKCEEKTPKNLAQETCPDRGSNPGPLRDERACYRLFHSGELICHCKLYFHAEIFVFHYNRSAGFRDSVAPE